MRGSQPCLSPSHSCCMHFPSCPSPFLLHACLLFPIFLQEHSLSFPPSLMYFAWLLPSQACSLSPFPVKLRVAGTESKPQLQFLVPKSSWLTLLPFHVLPPSPLSPASQALLPALWSLRTEPHLPAWWLGACRSVELGASPKQSVPDSPSRLSLVSLLRDPTAAARGTQLSTTYALARCCAGLVGSLPIRRLPAAQQPRWADPSPLALPPPVSRSLAATAVWGAVGVAASGTTWSPAPTSWATPVPEPR